MPSSVVFTVKDGDASSFTKSANKHSRQGDYQGMVKSRSTTDIVFLLGIICLWAAMSAIGGIAVQKGDPYRLIAPMDSQGSICGYSPSVQNRPVLFTVTNNGQGKCLDSCPTADLLTTGSGMNGALTFTDISRSNFVCLDWVDDHFNSGSDFAFYIMTSCVSGGRFSPYGHYDPSLSACACNQIYATTNYYNRCIFNEGPIRKLYNQSFYPDYFVGFMADIITARYIIFAFGFLLAIFSSFLWSHLLRFEAISVCVVWTGIAMVFCMTCALVGLCQSLALQWKNNPTHSSTAILALQAFSGIMVIIVGLFLCACIFLRRSINLAIKTIALAASAIEAMPLLAFTPLLQILGLAIFMVPCLFYSFNIATAGKFVPVTTTCYGVPPMCSPKSNMLPVNTPSYDLQTGITYQLDTTSSGEQLWYLFFCLLWTMNFIAGIGSMVIAVACAKW
jgi:Plasma-membrane choline transporter